MEFVFIYVGTFTARHHYYNYYASFTYIILCRQVYIPVAVCVAAMCGPLPIVFIIIM